jgi:hypothetical protein
VWEGWCWSAARWQNRGARHSPDTVPYPNWPVMRSGPSWRSASASACGAWLERHNHDSDMSTAEHLSLPAEQLTAHQPPALLVERALAFVGNDGRVRLKPHDGLDGFQLTEACAQALAVLMGLRLRGDGTGARASGMLVGAKAMRLVRTPRPGETVEVEARQTAELGPLQLYEVRALAMPAGEELLTGELKVARTGGDA